MKWNPRLLHPPYERRVEPSRRWWLGWLQLLCAWVLCMLLCANIALVLAKGLPEEITQMRGGKTVACMATETAARSVGALPCKAHRGRIFAL
jgi:hypothetical protein